MSFVKKISLILLGIVVGFFSPLLTAQATITAPPKDFYVWQRSQRAVLILEDKTQTLVLSPQIKGDLKNFLWIIPLPSEPEIKEVGNGLFDSLTKITKKKITPVNGEKDSSSVPEKSSDLEVIKEADLELYETETLKPETIGEVTTYLSDNDYFLPEESNYLFEEYISLGWYLVLVEVKISELSAFADSQSFEAYLPPIQLTFKSKNLYYPVKLLKINEILRTASEEPEETSIQNTEEEISQGESDFSSSNFDQGQLPESIPVDLFVFASHKKTLSGFETLYGNWITKKELSALASDQDDSPWYQTKADKLFLTQLSGSLKPSAINSDLILKNASNDKTTVSTQTKSTGFNWLLGALLFFIALIAILLSPIGLFFILGATIASLAKTKRARILGWALEILVLLILTLILLSQIWAPYIIPPKVKLDTSSLQSGLENYEYFTFSALAIWILGMLITLILQIRKSKRQQTKDSRPLPEKNIADKIFDEKDKSKADSRQTADATSQDKKDDLGEKEIELEEEPPKPKKHYTKKIKIDQQK